MAQETKVKSHLEDHLGYHLRRASLLDLNDFAAHFADVALRPVPFTVLCTIDEQPGITAADICRFLNLQRANIVHILADFESDGLIERRTDTEDQRIQRLFVSSKGRQSLVKWHERIRQREDRLFEALTASERTTLRKLLAKIWKNDPSTRQSRGRSELSDAS